MGAGPGGSSKQVGDKEKDFRETKAVPSQGAFSPCVRRAHVQEPLRASPGDEGGREAQGDPCDILAECAPCMLIVRVTSDDSTFIQVFNSHWTSVKRRSCPSQLSVQEGRRL